MIALHPPLTGGSPLGEGHRALLEHERFVRTRNMGRWHIPRSGIDRPATDWHPAFRTVTAWCGYGLSRGWAKDYLARDDWPDDGAPVCGTCAGRAAGVDVDVPELVFAPWTLEIPPVCPGSKIPGLYLPVPGNPGGTLARPTVVCLACDGITKEAGGSRGYGWTALHAAPHEPEQLVAPCPFHGWRELVPDAGTSRCRCGADPWPDG